MSNKNTSVCGQLYRKTSHASRHGDFRSSCRSAVKPLVSRDSMCSRLLLRHQLVLICSACKLLARVTRSFFFILRELHFNWIYCAAVAECLSNACKCNDRWSSACTLTPILQFRLNHMSCRPAYEPAGKAIVSQTGKYPRRSVVPTRLSREQRGKANETKLTNHRIHRLVVAPLRSSSYSRVSRSSDNMYHTTQTGNDLPRLPRPMRFLVENTA